MTISVKWYNEEKTIILQKRERGWTWEEFDAAVDQYTALARSVEHRVALLVDCLDAPDAPSAAALPHYQRASRLNPKNLVVMVIVVRVGGFLQTMGQVYSTATHSREFLQFVHTMEEGEALCKEILARAAEDH